MTKPTHAAILAVCLASLGVADAAQAERPLDAVATELVRQAIDAELVRDEPPSHTRWTVELAADRGGRLSGVFERWVGRDDRTRSSTTLPSYFDHHWTTGDRRHVRWSSLHRPERVWQLERALLGSGERLRRLAACQPKKIRRTKGRSEKLSCVSVGGCIAEEICFGETTKHLRRVAFRHAIESDVLRYTVEYDDLRSSGDKLVPHRIRLSENGRAVVDARLTIFERAELPDATFEPPAEAFEIPWCREPTDPVRIHTERPEYPAAARLRHDTGVVNVSTWIDVDGTVTHPQVLRGGDPALDAAAVEAVKRWRYTPARCGDVPIPVNLVVSVEFALRN